MGIVSSISGHLNPVSGQRIINSHVLLVETELSVNITQFNSPLKFKLQWSNEVCTRCVYISAHFWDICSVHLLNIQVIIIIYIQNH